MDYRENIIRTEGLSYTYSVEGEELSFRDTPPALKNINLTFKRGEYVAILGHNGSGKSTLAKLFNLILFPTVGKIYVDGVDISRKDITDDEVLDIRKKIGMVFQNPDNQLVATVVEEDVAFGPENLGLPREEIKTRVDEALELVGMQEYRRHAPHKLSGGQKQRIAIAGIIAMKPDLIIFDESTAMLDPLGRREVIEIMEKLNREENITVLNITHYMQEAARADRVIVINDGEVLLDGTARDVFSRVELLHSVGRESPQCVELIHKLSNMGFPVTTDVFTDEECIEAIRALLTSSGGEI